MNEQMKAVIIGAGVGGITTALLLARNGYSVTIYEKNANPGGRCGQLIQNGHRFDLGATILLMPSLYRQVFSSLGLDMDKELETTSLEPVYKLFFGDGTDFAFTRNPVRMKEQLEAIEPGSFAHYEKYVKEGYEFFGQSMDGLLNRNFYHLFQFINLKSTLLLIRLKTWIKHTDYIQRFFKDPRLQKAFTFQNIYVGQNPYKQPAFFSMLPGAEIAEGALFPKGGMHRVVEKLLEEATRAGVKIHYKKAVSKIVVSGNKTEGVLLENGKMIHAGVVVANADLPYIYNELLPDKRIATQLKKKEYSCSAIVFHWGVDKIYPQLDHHSIFLNEPYKESMEKIFNEKSLSGNPSFYVHAPARTDKSAAPENEDTLSVIIPVGHIDEKYDQDWQEIKQSARESVICRLKEAGLTDIEEHIKFEICFMPKTFESYCNVTNGSVFGSLSHTIFQMGYFRPHNRHRKYKNLYFTGGSTHPGNGVPLVLLSAKLTSERIIKEIKITPNP
ncbi:MAG TPA: phytoene desaturase family protein [Paludibacter sp.]|nr:phytoene desaturase family protein [Paludibacter sp.]